jgi:hypothetical protein
VTAWTLAPGPSESVTGGGHPGRDCQWQAGMPQVLSRHGTTLYKSVTLNRPNARAGPAKPGKLPTRNVNQRKPVQI